MLTYLNTFGFMVAVFVGYSNLFSCHGQTGITNWDSLYTTFGSFYWVPITQEEAEDDDNWDVVFDCNDSTAVGNVFFENEDISSMPIYNIDGLIAGIILGMKNPGNSSKVAPWKKYTKSDGTTFWGIEAHFRDPTTTCDFGNSANTNGTIGDRLWFAHGNDGTYFGIPLTEDTTALGNEGWYNGKCVILMGQHWWRNISPDMDCNDTYPLFLLYTRGKLNGWGIAQSHDDRPNNLTSDRWEHPGGSVLKAFFQDDDFPECLLDQGTLNTQHVYMTNYFLNNCL